MPWPGGLEYPEASLLGVAERVCTKLAWRLLRREAGKPSFPRGRLRGLPGSSCRSSRWSPAAPTVAVPGDRSRW